MDIPIIAICGRPNVGKSTIFNILSGKKISIVDPTSGVTRDRITCITQLNNHYFELMDTGGIGIVDNQNLEDAVTEQIHTAIEQAQIILFVVDIKDGLTPLDRQVADLLRKCKAKVILVANKTDTPNWRMEQDQFRKLGFGVPVCVSALEMPTLDDLKDELEEYIEDFPTQKPDEAQLKIAIVGKPNSGKSTLINSLANEDRMIVSEIPGTTRDSVDVYFKKNNQTIIAIDTAGVKRSKNLHDNIQYYSQHRAERSIRRADVVILLMDATTKINRVDKELADYIVKENKPAIICVNKWDLVPNIPTEEYNIYISKMLPNMHYVPLSFITAKDGKNVQATIDLAQSLFKQSKKEIGTGKLNKAIKKVITKKAPPFIYGKQGKIYYATQLGVLPPTFLLFVNNPDLFTDNYNRYIINQLRQELGLPEIPLRLEFRKRQGKGKKPTDELDRYTYQDRNGEEQYIPEEDDEEYDEEYNGEYDEEYNEEANETDPSITVS